MRSSEHRGSSTLVLMHPSTWAFLPDHGKMQGMARPKGFEPLTPRFVVWCSIQLSYGRLTRRRALGPPV